MRDEEQEPTRIVRPSARPILAATLVVLTMSACGGPGPTAPEPRPLTPAPAPAPAPFPVQGPAAPPAPAAPAASSKPAPQPGAAPAPPRPPARVETSAAAALKVALETGPSGKALAWRDPATGRQGSVTPYPARRLKEGETCRDFRASQTAPGSAPREGAGTACREPDGTWRIVRGEL